MRMRRMVLKKRKKKEKGKEGGESIIISNSSCAFPKAAMTESRNLHGLNQQGGTASQAWRPEVGNPGADRATLPLKPSLSLPGFLWFPGNLWCPLACRPITLNLRPIHGLLLVSLSLHLLPRTPVIWIRDPPYSRITSSPHWKHRRFANEVTFGGPHGPIPHNG